MKGISGNLPPIPDHQPVNRTGTRVPASRAEQIAEVADQAANLPSGFALTAGDYRFEIPSGRAATIGRLPGSDLELESPSVSRNHAQVRVQDGKVQICDVGSSFGTTVNGHRLEPKMWYNLPAGATLGLANVEMKLSTPNDGQQKLTFPAAQQGMASAVQAAQGAVGGIAGYLFQDATGRQLMLKQEGEYTLGRSPENSITLGDDLQLSRQHGRLRLDEGVLSYKDSNSTNGSFINGQRVEPGEWVALPPNSSIRMGQTEIQLTGIPAAAPLAQQGQSAGFQAAASAIGGPVGAVLTGLQLGDLAALAGKTELESKESYLSSIQNAQAALNQESGIVDLPKGVPTLVLSDIHARRDFIMKALEHEVDGVKVFDLLKQGKINLVCVGDGMHAEGRAADRWEQAEQDMMRGRPSEAMNQEMIESFGTMKMVMDLKSEFPENFHFCRGNHDEIKGSFAKYARMVGESAMVQSWVQKNLGQDFLDQFARFEESLPLVVRGEGFVASHAAPGGQLDRAAVEQRDPKAFAQLSWTDNRGWNDRDAGVQQKFQQNLKEVGGEGGRWLVGHRPVDSGNYRSQFGGQLVQINAPDDFVVALVPADGKMVPDRDVFSLAR